MKSSLVVVWLGAFAFFLSFHLLLSALPLFARRLGASDAAIGLIMGSFAVSAMLLRPPVGWAADRWGRKPLMVGGAAVFLACSLGYGFTAGAAGLLVVRLAHGAGMGLYPTAASALVADVAPPGRRGEYLGLFGAAGSLAMAIGPIAGVTLAGRHGFGALFLVSAAIALAAVLLAAAVTETLVHRAAAPFRLATTLSRSALWPSLVTLCLMLTYGAVVSFLPLHADRHGVNPGVFFLVYALVLTVARGPAGRLSDRLGRASVAGTGLLLAAVALTVLALSEGALGLALAGGAYGLAFGTAQPALMAWCVDGVAAGDRGRAMGTFYTALELGIAIGAMSAGVVATQWGFAATFFGTAVVALGGGALSTVVRPQRGWSSAP